MKNAQTKIFGTLVLLIYLLIPLFLFQNVVNLGNGYQMTSMPNCPHESGEQAICPMDFSFYSSIFDTTSTINTKDLKIFLLISVLSLSFLFISKKPKDSPLFFYFKNQKYLYLSDLYLWLYSRGILNGKAY